MLIKRLGAFLAVYLLGTVMAMGQSLRLPHPPGNVTGVPERAGWLIDHYWDLSSPGDFLLEEETEGGTMEQAFVNYLSLFPLAENDSLCRASVFSFMQRADSAQACRPVFSLAVKYLFDLLSPLADEEKFRFFLDAASNCLSISPIQRQECIYWRQVIDSNRIGSEIAEFSFETADGNQLLFSEIEGERLLLLFDIMCQSCHEMIDKLRSLTLEGMSVVAIAINADRESLRSFAKELPDKWIIGHDNTGTVNGDAFAIRLLPDLYRVSSEGIVIDKHCNLEED